MKGYKITVRGRVQGVYYRNSTQKKAEELGIVGSVKNETDGTVTILAYCNQEKLDELVSWCKQGPKLAHVIDYNIAEVPYEQLKSFDVVY